MAMTVSRTDLARRTREIIDQVQRGQTIIVESYGEEQIVLLDALDYRLLLALAKQAASVDPESGSADAVLHDYLTERISLAKAAEMLGLSRFDLAERFERLGVPLRQGPASLEEAQAEVGILQRR